MILSWVLFTIWALGAALLGFGLVLQAAGFLLRWFVTPLLRTNEARQSHRRAYSDCVADGSIFITVGLVLSGIAGTLWWIL